MSVLANHYISTVTFSPKSNLAKDAITNTFHWTRKDGVSEVVDMANAIEPLLEAFYSTFASVLAGDVITPGATLRTYDGSLPIGDRVPDVRLLTIGTYGSGTQYPAEIALCLSFVGGRNLPRRRGRVYIGPFVASGGQTGISAGDGRPSTGIVSTVSDAGAELMNDAAATTQLNWTVFSPTANDMHSVTGGWVDNAWDTQRRRGTAASLRDQFGTYTS